MKRESGILMHISSLPSKYGIGTMGKEAYRFVDFLKSAKQGIWQILPFGPTGYADSPYQSFSIFAGNPYFIDLDMLVEEKLLTREEVEAADFPDTPGTVDYGALYKKRLPLLNWAFRRGFRPDSPEYRKFLDTNSVWIYDYSFFAALKEHFDFMPLSEWPFDIKSRQQEAMHSYGLLLEERINFHRFIQFLFFRQYVALKAYANENGVRMFGDIPIYPSSDSADVWSWPQNYQLDSELRPKAVAGVPPDYFSADGQLWGNPLYNWEQHKNEDYHWWTLRFAHLNGLFDAVRIDHFRGFHTYFCIPFGEKTARNGHWEMGPGAEFVRHMCERFPDLLLIAEDLGDLDDEVLRFVEETGLPGMRVFQFAFDGPNSPYLPHNHIRNTVVYTGTHDNDTIKGWLSKNTKATKYAREYFYLNEKEGDVYGVIRAGMSSVADLFIVPIQDYLELGSPYRMNTPSVTHGNWTFRILKDSLTDALARRIAALTVLYARAEPDLPTEKTRDDIRTATDISFTFSEEDVSSLNSALDLLEQTSEEDREIVAPANGDRSPDDLVQRVKDMTLSFDRNEEKT